MIASKMKTTLLATFAIVAATSLVTSGGVASPAFAHTDDNDHHSDHNHGHNHDLRNFFDCVRDHGGKSISKNELNRCDNRYLD
jgi:hypothetical protein